MEYINFKNRNKNEQKPLSSRATRSGVKDLYRVTFLT